MKFHRSHAFSILALTTILLAVFTLLALSIRQGAAAGSEDGIVYLPAVLKPVPPPCSTAPTLLSPISGSNLDTIYPIFRFDAGEDQQANWIAFILDDDPALGSPTTQLFVRYPTGEKTVTLMNNLEPATTYYWQTWLLCGEPGEPAAETGPRSELGTFTTGNGGVIPEIPTLLAPENGETVTITDERVTLQWDAVLGAQDYWLIVTPEDSCGQHIWTAGTERTVFVDEGVTYSWSVQARSDYALGERSERWEFHVPDS
ncbi:MAG: hypothetical protein ACOC9C_03445 [Chloroflexota bacterium]